MGRSLSEFDGPMDGLSEGIAVGEPTGPSVKTPTVPKGIGALVLLARDEGAPVLPKGTGAFVG